MDEDVVRAAPCTYHQPDIQIAVVENVSTPVQAAPGVKLQLGAAGLERGTEQYFVLVPKQIVVFAVGIVGAVICRMLGRIFQVWRGLVWTRLQPDGGT